MNDKPKWKSTEFWLTLIATIVSILFMSGVVHPGTGIDKSLGTIVAVLATLGYNVSRAQAKKTQDGDKPGYKTSEFWFTTIQTVLGFVVASGAVEGTEVDKTIGAVGAGLSAMGYAPVRAVAKAPAVKTIVLLALLWLPGCCADQYAQKQAETLVYKAVAQQYVDYVEADKDLDSGERVRYYRTIYTWGKRLEQEIPKEAQNAFD